MRDSAQTGINVYWNLGIAYVKSNYKLKRTTASEVQGHTYLSQVGIEASIGLKYNFNRVGFFAESGLNKLDDKTRAVVQGGLSFYLF